VSKLQLHEGAWYRVKVKASRVEKMFANRQQLQRMLVQSGLSEIEWKVTRSGFTVQGKYSGPTGIATLPDRVTEVRRFQARPRPL
jgi:hypothetical protein